MKGGDRGSESQGSATVTKTKITPMIAAAVPVAIRKKWRQSPGVTPGLTPGGGPGSGLEGWSELEINEDIGQAPANQ